ncbi:MAG: MarR family transcriptional regulator [Novosphingobium sp.]|nr:MarR family transcriptional regulator [Novosphingobium sp.]
MAKTSELTDGDYAMLADFRHELRQFQAFSEDQAAGFGLTPQQHQALLAIRGSPGASLTVGALAQRLMLKPHSATGLVNRLVALGLAERRSSPDDRRHAILQLTPRAQQLLAKLSSTHRQELARLGPMLIGLLEQLK